jgi:DNA-binding transcriptional ArsR family regulator
VIRISLDETTLARTRITTSPLIELVCSLYLLARYPGEAPWPYADWARRAREVLAKVPQTAPLRLYQEMDLPAPDLFTPFPRVAAPSLAQELEVLRATPRAAVDAEFARYYTDMAVPEWARPYQEDPARAFGKLADGIAAFWQAAIAPYWPAMRAALDEEVLHRAQALAAEGPDALLKGLHERLRWDKPVLTLVKRHEHSFHAANQRLLLIPLIFSRGALLCSVDDPEVVAVSYQARGAAVLAECDPTRSTPDEDRLGILLGRGRATVLRGLSRPRTTTGLAAALGLAPSTVSEHLSVLVEAGVAYRRRAGRRVLYGLEPAGLALVTLITFDSEAGPASSHPV